MSKTSEISEFLFNVKIINKDDKCEMPKIVEDVKIIGTLNMLGVKPHHKAYGCPTLEQLDEFTKRFGDNYMDETNVEYLGKIKRRVYIKK